MGNTNKIFSPWLLKHKSRTWRRYEVNAWGSTRIWWPNRSPDDIWRPLQSGLKVTRPRCHCFALFLNSHASGLSAANNLYENMLWGESRNVQNEMEKRLSKENHQDWSGQSFGYSACILLSPTNTNLIFTNFLALNSPVLFFHKSQPMLSMFYVLMF